jgi:hypothetical protein
MLIGELCGVLRCGGARVGRSADPQDVSACWHFKKYRRSQVRLRILCARESFLRHSYAHGIGRPSTAEDEHVLCFFNFLLLLMLERDAV